MRPFKHRRKFPFRYISWEADFKGGIENCYFESQRKHAQKKAGKDEEKKPDEKEKMQRQFAEHGKRVPPQPSILEENYLTIAVRHVNKPSLDFFRQIKKWTLYMNGSV